MTIDARVKAVKSVLNRGRELTARQICNCFIKEVTSSDICSAQIILNVMSALGLVSIRNTSNTRSPRYVYKLKVKCPVVEQFKR